jgi:lambda family phage portal protein
MIGQWLDAVTATVAPLWTLRRMRARMAADMVRAHFDGASVGRRTQGWRRTSADANAAMSGDLARLRDYTRDLVRNNAYAEGAVSTIVDDVVGWGITADAAPGWWSRWAETPACDADGREDLYGLQTGVMRTVVESGECLIRRRWRRPEDGLPIPLQLQVMEPDFLDSAKDGITTPRGGRIIQGIEVDSIGRRVAYWLHREHPGANIVGAGAISGASVPVPASEILHVYRPGRRGAVRGYPWFAPVMLRMRDYDDYVDAALMKQKIAACLAVLTTDTDGTSTPLGVVDAASPAIDMLQPGMIENLAAGRDVKVVEPPSVSEHDAYSRTVLREIARGLGMTYEDFCGDYADLPFSAARMSNRRYWLRVEALRWKMLIPQFCGPVWGWAMEAAGVMGMPAPVATDWTAPPAPSVDPEKEGTAAVRLIRSSLSSWSEEIRKLGHKPETLLRQLARDHALLDALKIISDADPRNTTQQGNPRTTSTDRAPAAEPAMNGNGRHG